MNWLLGALLASLVAWLVWQRGTLRRSGALAAFAVGTATFGSLGWRGALVLFAFFLPSVLLSRLGHTRKRAFRDIGKSGARDGWQVLANGAIAAGAALLSLRFGAPLAAACAGSFAAAAADTWGTEIGTLAPGRPRSILTLRPMATGLSGGISALGTLAAIGGALVVAACAAWCGLAPLGAVLAAGIGGAAVDSIAGAGVQALRHCNACDVDCEIDPHHCGNPTVLRRGFAWLGNDAVNFACTLAGALIAALLVA